MSNFWDSSIDQSIKDFTKCKDPKVREKIYTKNIYPAFLLLISVYFTKYPIKYDLQKEFQADCMSFMYEILCRYKYPKKGQVKPFTFFFITIKQFWYSNFVEHSKINIYTHSFSALEDDENNALNVLINLPSQERNFLENMEAEDTKKIIIDLIEHDIKSFKTESKNREKMLRIMVKYLKETPFDEMERLKGNSGNPTENYQKTVSQMNDNSLWKLLQKEFPKWSKQSAWNNMNKYKKQLKREFDAVKDK